MSDVLINYYYLLKEKKEKNKLAMIKLDAIGMMITGKNPGFTAKYDNKKAATVKTNDAGIIAALQQKGFSK